MREIVFATNNSNKLKEIRAAVSHIRIIGLQEAGINEELPETQDTLEGNALQKAQYVFDKYGKACFADDTGLEIAGLDGRPGVYSARYAGPECKAENNMQKVLGEMEGIQDRSAQFRTIICLINEKGENTLFEGAVDGQITTEKSGADGFGYDPIFQPENEQVTFAEMTMEKKNEISHRGRAVRKLIEFLKSAKV